MIIREFKPYLCIKILVLMNPLDEVTLDPQELQLEREPDEQGQDYITDGHEFLKFCQSEKKIKIMDQQNPVFNRVYLKDISLHKKGPLEDKMYAKIGKFYRNIRRGNTLCQIYDDQGEESALFFCRRGMKKFYDLESEYLKVEANLTYFNKRMRNRIFEELDAVLDRGDSKIHLYSIFKENGEHCQVSYIERLGAWLFASKNVAILARNQADLQEYQKERFYWAKLIAEQFLKIIAGFTHELITSFISDISGKTLLGQHCGYDKHQHITKYENIELIFYGLVVNTGRTHCQPVEECRKFLSKYRLKMSQTKEITNLSDKNTVYESMHKMLKSVAEGSMDTNGEGSVLYIVQENKKSQQKTIGMCKLKTAEYLIFRKLREMLKVNAAKKGSTANTFEKFKFQINNLVTSYFKPPKPLQYYFALGQLAFKEVNLKDTEITEEYLRYKFVQFLQRIQKNEVAIEKTLAHPQKVLLVCLPYLTNIIEKYCKANDISVDYIYRPTGQKITKNTLYVLHMVPRLSQKIDDSTQIIICQYEEKEVAKVIVDLDKYSDLNRSHLISFVKSEDKEKTIHLLHDKIKQFQAQCKDKNILFWTCDQIDKEISIVGMLRKLLKVEESIVNQFQPLNYNKYIIMPLLMPGSGKTTLAQLLKGIHNFEGENVSVEVLQSDKLRRELMDREKEIDLDERESNNIFKKTAGQALEKYFQLVETKVMEQLGESHQILFLDRAFCPGTIQKNIEFIVKLNRPYVKLVVVTQNYNTTKLNETMYPFSVNYLLVCLKRCLQRKEHMTLVTQPYQIIKIIFKYYQMYSNYNQKSVFKSARESCCDFKVIQLPFVEECEDKGTNQHIKKKIEECLKMVRPGFDSKDSQIFLQLIEVMYKFMAHLNDRKPEDPVLVKQFMKKVFTSSK